MDKEKFIKDNFIYMFLIIAAIAGGIYAVYNFGTAALESHNNVISKKAEVQTKEAKLNQLKQEKISNTPKKRKSESGKVIYEVLNQQFSPEASFGIMFENILSNITNSGIRIRSIEYNYQPAEDRILMANIPQYNACELSFVTVGNYSQLQSFFKSIAKEKYLTSIHEVYIEPYDKDKTILIAKFKIRLYTKTI